MPSFRVAKLALASTAITLGWTASVPAQSLPDFKADLILTNGNFYTPDGWAQAVAIKNGVLLAVGSADEAETYQGEQTQIRDLRGRTVFPGLHDMHIHTLGSGQQQLQCQFPQGSKLETVKETLSACVAKASKGDWIMGGQWSADGLGASPDRRFLDEVAPDNPVAMIDISYHSYWLNSKALELAGINSQTPTPEGGVIERDNAGQPTGVLRETARALFQAKVPPASPAQNMTALKWALDKIVSYGLTSYTDAGLDFDAAAAFAALEAQGELGPRVRGCFYYRPNPGTNEATTGDSAQRLVTVFAGKKFKPDCIKIALDGVPTEGHTAAMLAPYADARPGDDHAHSHGILMVSQDQLNAAVTAFDARGLAVKMHAAGDAAVRAGLDAIEAARTANGNSGILHDVAHNSFVAMGDIERARRIGATFEMSPYIWFPNPIIPDIVKAVGNERMERWTPVKDAIDAGALVVPGSDWAVVPSVNPWLGMETLVTRQAPGGGGELLGGQQRITLKQAVDLYTVNAARHMGNANLTGQIMPGLQADLIVLDQNPFEVPITDVHKTEVLLSMVGGETLYTSKNW